MRSLLVIICFSSLLILGVVAQQAFGEGAPPSACYDLYNASITQARILYPGGSVDLIAHPNVTVSIPTTGSYTLNVLARTSAVSIKGDSNSNGSSYFESSYMGFDFHTCVSASFPSMYSPQSQIGPNENVNMTFPAIALACCFDPSIGGIQHITFGVYGAPVGFAYNVDWVAPQQTTTQSQIPLYSTSSMQSSSFSSSTGSISSSTSTIASSTSSVSSTTHAVPEFPSWTLSLVLGMVLGASIFIVGSKWARR